MHVVFRESHGLEETETPTDLGQSPADLVVLSFSDSDLGAFAEGWHRGPRVEPVEDPTTLGPIVRDMVKQARLNAGMNGEDWPLP